MRLLRLLPGCLLLVVGLAVAAEADDPVAELGRIISTPLGKTAGKETLEARRKKLDMVIARLNHPADLCRAASLLEWRHSGPHPGGDFPPALEEVHREARKKLGERLVRVCRERLAKDGATQQAILVLVARAARSEQEPIVIRGEVHIPGDPGPLPPLFPALRKDVEKALKKGLTQPVRSAALRALVHLGLGPEEQAEHLKSALGAGNVAERQAAGAILLELVGPGPAPRVTVGTLPEETAKLVAPAGVGVVDEDPTVRRLCLQALAETMNQLNMVFRTNLPSNPVQWELNYPEGSKERGEVLGLIEKDLAPALAGLAQVERLLPRVTKMIDGSDLGCTLATLRVLEQAATARLLLREWLHLFPKEKRPDVCKSAVAAVPALAKALGHKELRVRVETVHVLESLAAEAGEAGAALADALTKDDSRFVRWGAARALRNMAPAGGEKVVPALARALADDSAEVRIAAAQALMSHGTKAKPAREALTKASSKGDEKVRVLALQALAALGKEAAPSEAALVDLLADDLPAIRAGAAHVLGKIGKLEEKSTAALRKAIADPDPGVQEAAATALLSAG